MKKLTKKTISVLLAAVMLLSMVAAMPFTASAAESKHVLTINVDSNLFPKKQCSYVDLDSLENNNGDIFVTVEFKLCANGRKIINMDLDDLLWDTSVLEWKKEYNMTGTGRTAYLDIFPFTKGAAMYNTFGENSGRIIGNYTSPTSPAWGYNTDGSAVTIVKAVFKLIDRTVTETTITCKMDTINLCDETVAQPYSQHNLVDNCIVNENVKKETGLFTVFSPATQILKGDVRGTGTVSIQDATEIQKILADFDDALDSTDPMVLLAGDVNCNGRLDVGDVTEIQRYLAGIPSMLD